MSRQRIYKQVCGILEANDLTWNETPNGGFFLRFSSAGVVIDLLPWGTQTVIHFSSNVLSDVEESADRVLEEVNRLNKESQFARWVYDLLGDHLQENELMTALNSLARQADFHDDQLQKKMRGRRTFEV
jgi:hypothetical protein